MRTHVPPHREPFDATTRPRRTPDPAQSRLSHALSTRNPRASVERPSTNPASAGKSGNSTRLAGDRANVIHHQPRARGHLLFRQRRENLHASGSPSCAAIRLPYQRHQRPLPSYTTQPQGHDSRRHARRQHRGRRRGPAHRTRRNVALARGLARSPKTRVCKRSDVGRRAAGLSPGRTAMPFRGVSRSVARARGIAGTALATAANHSQARCDCFGDYDMLANGSARAHSFSNRRPLPGCPHPHPLAPATCCC